MMCFGTYVCYVNMSSSVSTTAWVSGLEQRTGVARNNHRQSGCVRTHLLAVTQQLDLFPGHLLRAVTGVIERFNWWC